MGTAIVGRYVVLGPIGRGGVSVVYQAIDTLSPRPLAVKLLGSALAGDARAQDNVRREALITDRVRHPSVPRIYDYGDTALPDGTVTPYVVMELLTGVSLASRLSGRPLPWPEAVRIAATIADVLAVAHRRGFVHRDVTADNVMLTGSGVKIIDFGLAATVERPRPDRPRLTRTTVPRRPVVPAHTVAQPADDVYALGVLLYQMVTGRSPYPGGMVGAHVRCMAPTPVLAVTGLPREIADICRSSMAKRVADRPASRDLALALWTVIRASLKS
jgi:serine/threonine protein kinase